MDLRGVRQWMTRGEQNLVLLESLIPASEKLYVWCYDQDGSFVATSCPEPEREILENAFTILGGREKLLRYAEDTDNTRPQIIAANKMDLPDGETGYQMLKEHIGDKYPVFPVSAATRQGAGRESPI